MTAQTKSPYEFAEEIVTALTTEKIFTDWCEAQFSRQPDISMSYNESEPALFDADPLVSEYPLIAITSMGHALGQGDQNIDYSITLKACVHNTGRTKVGRVTYFAGMEQVEAFRVEIQNAIFRANLMSGMSIDGGYDSLSEHPFHEAYVNLKSAVPASKQKRHPY